MTAPSMKLAWISLLSLTTNVANGFQTPTAPSYRSFPSSHTTSIHHRSLRHSTFIQSSQTNDADAAPSSSSGNIVIDPTVQSQIRSIAQHLSSQTFETLLSQQEAHTITHQLFFTNNSSTTASSSSIFNDRTYQQYNHYWDKLILRWKKEQRTPADLLGEKITKKIIKTIRGGENDAGGTYDVNTVRTFLESDAINSLFAKLLYDAIFEFTTRFDILGNAISNLPLLGPMRTQILKESKRNMDRTLGPFLQKFLSGYTRVAIRQAVDFIVSEENASSFGRANAKLVRYLLEGRTVAEWIPRDDNTLDQWREDVWGYLVGLENENDGDGSREDQKRLIGQTIDWTYELVGDKCIQDLGVDVDALLDSSPMLEKKLGDFWVRVQDASQSSEIVE